jgi:hypothetical protein
MPRRFQFEAEGVPASYDRPLARRLARAWHGQTAETDAMMGTVLDALDRSPAANDTFILFTSDHVRPVPTIIITASFPWLICAVCRPAFFSILHESRKQSRSPQIFLVATGRDAPGASPC